jgi:uncharacterized membrane protein YdfJ with MMPL/SSD domain
MRRVTSFVLDHKRLVVGVWLAVTVAAFAAIGPAGNSLSQQFDLPGREGFETNREIATIYGSGGDIAPLVPVVTLPRGTTVDAPGIAPQLDAALDEAPEDVQEEILRINTEARNLSLQVALLVSVLASLIGLLNSFRMRRLPDIAPATSIEGTVLG